MQEEEFDVLLVKLLQGKTSQKENLRINECLKKSPERRREFLEQTELTVLLKAHPGLLVRDRPHDSFKWWHAAAAVASIVLLARAGTAFLKRQNTKAQAPAPVANEVDDMKTNIIATVATTLAIPLAATAQDWYTWLDAPADNIWNTTSKNWNYAGENTVWGDGGKARLPRTSSQKNITVEGTRSVSEIENPSGGNYTLSGGLLQINGTMWIAANTVFETPVVSTSEATEGFRKSSYGTLTLKGDNSLKRLRVNDGTLVFSGGKTVVDGDANSSANENSAIFVNTGKNLQIVEGAQVDFNKKAYVVNRGNVLIDNATVAATNVNEWLNAWATNSGIVTVRNGGVLHVNNFRPQRNTEAAKKMNAGLNLCTNARMVVRTRFTVDNGGHGFMRFDGGTLECRNSNTTLFGSQTGGATADTAWQDTDLLIGSGGLNFENHTVGTTINRPLLSGVATGDRDGGLTVGGENILYIGKANTFNGGVRFGRTTRNMTFVATSGDGAFGAVPETPETNLTVEANSAVCLFAPSNFTLNENRHIGINSNAIFRVAAQKGATFTIKGEIHGEQNKDSPADSVEFRSITAWDGGGTWWGGKTVLDPGEGHTNHIGRLRVEGNLEIASGTTVVSAPQTRKTSGDAPVYVASYSNGFTELSGNLIVSGGELKLDDTRGYYVHVNANGHVQVNGGIFDCGNNEYLNALAGAGKTTVSGGGVLRCRELRLAQGITDPEKAVVTLSTNGLAEIGCFYLDKEGVAATIAFDGGSVCPQLAYNSYSTPTAVCGLELFARSGGDINARRTDVANWFRNVQVKVMEGGAHVEAVNTNMHIRIPFVSGCENDGGFTKSGTWTTVFFTNNTYTGATVVKQGGLHLRAPENTLTPASTLRIYPGAFCSMYVDSGAQVPHQTIARVEGGGRFQLADRLTITEAVAPSDGEDGCGTLTFEGRPEVNGVLQVKLDEEGNADCMAVTSAMFDISGIAVELTVPANPDRTKKYRIFSANTYSGRFKSFKTNNNTWSIHYDSQGAYVSFNAGTVISLI